MLSPSSSFTNSLPISNLSQQPKDFTQDFYKKNIQAASTLKEAEKAFQQIIKDGLKPNVYSYNSLINAYKNLSPSPIAANNRCNEIFKEMKNKGIATPLFIYNTLLSIKCRLKKLDEIEALTQEMRSKKIKFDETTFNIFIATAARMNQQEKMAGYLKEMNQLALPFSVTTYNSVLRLYFHASEEEVLEIPEFLQLMKDQGVQPDIKTYNMMLKFLSRSKEGLEIQNSLLNEMKSKGLRPDSGIYNIIYRTKVERENFLSPEETLEEVRVQAGQNFKLEDYSKYMLYKNKAVESPEEAIKVLKDLMLQSEKPVAANFTHVMQQIKDLENLTNLEKSEAILSIYELAKEKKIVFEAIHFNILIKFFIDCNSPTQALEIWEEMRAKKIYPLLGTVPLLIKLVGQKGFIEAFELFQVLKKEGACLDIQAFTSMLYVLVQQDEIFVDISSFIEDLIKEKQKLKIEDDTNFHLGLTDAYVAVGELEKAREIVNKNNLLVKFIAPKKATSIPTLDCHTYNFGVTCLFLKKYLEDHPNTETFKIITGIGHHSVQNVKFAMRTHVIKFIKKHLPHVSIQFSKEGGALFLYPNKDKNLVKT